MAPNTPSGPPSQVIAGDSWRWKVADLSEYPQSEGWSLKYDLLGVSQTLTITPVWQSSGDDANHWLATVATTESDALDSGSYTLVLRVIGSGDYDGREETIDNVTHEAVRAGASPWHVQVAQDPRTAVAGDYQSFAELNIEIIEAAIHGRLTKDMQSYSVGGRSITKIDIETLHRLRHLYYLEKNAQNGVFGRDAQAVFNRVS